MFEIIGGIIVLTIMVLLSGIKVVSEHDRIVIFRFGKALHTKGPGLQLVVPMIDRAQIVDVRTVTLPIDLIEETTADHLTVKVSALCMFRIADPKKMVTHIDNARKATRELAETTLRNHIHQHRLHYLYSDRKRINSALKQALNKHVHGWGIHIQTMEIKEVKIPRETKRLLTAKKRESEHHEPHHGTPPSLLKALAQLSAHP